MTKSTGDGNTKVNTESLRNAAIRNTTSDPSYQNLRKALQPISIILTIPILGIQHRSSSISPVVPAVQTINSAMAFKESLRKPKDKSAKHSLRQRDHKTYLVSNIHGNMQRVNAQIDCGAMSIFISASLLWKLELPYQPAMTLTLARC
jgi:hypothetical protein